jgi:hypothetical protein
MLLGYQARHVQQMQKALAQMNLQLTQVISGVAGETGRKIIRAILSGDRDGATLAKLRKVRIKASGEEIAKALQGGWREELRSVGNSGRQRLSRPLVPIELLGIGHVGNPWSPGTSASAYTGAPVSSGCA